LQLVNFKSNERSYKNYEMVFIFLFQQNRYVSRWEVEKKDLLREDFLKLCHSFHKVLDSDDYMDRLLDFVGLVVQVSVVRVLRN